MDQQTHFGAARFLLSSLLEDICYPDSVHIDEGTAFVSERNRAFCSTSVIQLNLVGIESHNSIGSVKKHHEPLRIIYMKILHEYPTIDLAFVLPLAVKSMNDTRNSEGLVPSLQLFGVLPHFSAVNTNLPYQVTWMNVIYTARKETETVTYLWSTHFSRSASKYSSVPRPSFQTRRWRTRLPGEKNV